MTLEVLEKAFEFSPLKRCTDPALLIRRLSPEQASPEQFYVDKL